MSELSAGALSVLDDGVLCYLAAPSPAGPHVTPVVYVLDGDRVWGTTGRATTKAARWRRDPTAGGLVSVDDVAVAFRGRVTLHDALDPSTWWASAARAPQLARASARFTLKNRRFFAGYARDAAHVPLAWTPPARVVFSVDLDATALLEGGRVRERSGSWSRGVAGPTTFRRTTGPLPELPDDVAELLAPSSGSGTLSLQARRGPVVVPIRWMRTGGVFHAIASRSAFGLAGRATGSNGSLVVDRASAWRAAKMRGVLLRGEVSVFLPTGVRSGAGALEEVIERAGPVDDPAVVRLRPRTAVWWSGWASGTVSAP